MRWTWIAVFVAALLWSAWNPRDPVIWILEVFPALIAVGVLWYTQSRFPLTRMTYDSTILSGARASTPMSRRRRRNFAV